MANIIHYSEGTDAVVNIAAQISALGDEFFSEYTSLYNLIENELNGCWRGEDFEAFKAYVNGEKHYFDSMRDVINEYATFLRNTANAHEARMEDSKNQVSTGCTF